MQDKENQLNRYRCLHSYRAIGYVSKSACATPAGPAERPQKAAHPSDVRLQQKKRILQPTKAEQRQQHRGTLAEVQKHLGSLAETQQHVGT